MPAELARGPAARSPAAGWASKLATAIPQLIEPGAVADRGATARACPNCAMRSAAARAPGCRQPRAQADCEHRRPSRTTSRHEIPSKQTAGPDGGRGGRRRDSPAGAVADAIGTKLAHPRAPQLCWPSWRGAAGAILRGRLGAEAGHCDPAADRAGRGGRPRRDRACLPQLGGAPGSGASAGLRDNRERRPIASTGDRRARRHATRSRTSRPAAPMAAERPRWAASLLALAVASHLVEVGEAHRERTHGRRAASCSLLAVASPASTWPSLHRVHVLKL